MSEIKDKIAQHYFNAILTARVMLDEDLEIVLNNCDYCRSDCKEGSEVDKWGYISVLCFNGVLAYKLRTLGLVITTPLTVYSVLQFYKQYKLKYYESSIDSLLDVFSWLHKTNRDVLEYLNTRELFRFRKNIAKRWDITENFHAILKKQISFVDFLMNKISQFCDIAPDVIFTEVWKIQDLHLDCFQDQEEFCENFSKLHDITILIISRFLCCTAITVHLSETVYQKLIPEALKFSKQHLEYTTKTFDSARSLPGTEKQFSAGNERTKKQNLSSRLEQPLSKLLTHMQLTYELAQSVQSELNKGEKALEDMSEQVLALQEELTICEQSLDQFCGTYGILIRKNLVKAETAQLRQPDGKTENSNGKAVKVIAQDEEIEEGDQEFELYVGESSEDDSEIGAGYGGEEDAGKSTASLLLVLQELKDRLKERQIMRAKRLGLPLPEEDSVAEEQDKKERQESDQSHVEEKQFQEIETKPPKIMQLPPLPPPFLHPNESSGSQETASHSLTDAIKLIAQQRHCKEDVFQDSDTETDST